MNKTKDPKKKERRLSKDRAKYAAMYLKHNDEIPENFLSTVLQKHPDWNANRVNNVRYGKTVDLEMFKEILKLTTK